MHFIEQRSCTKQVPVTYPTHRGTHWQTTVGIKESKSWLCPNILNYRCCPWNGHLPLPPQSTQDRGAWSKLSNLMYAGIMNQLVPASAVCELFTLLFQCLETPGVQLRNWNGSEFKFWYMFPHMSQKISVTTVQQWPQMESDDSRHLNLNPQWGKHPYLQWGSTAINSLWDWWLPYRGIDLWCWFYECRNLPTLCSNNIAH